MVTWNVFQWATNGRGRGKPCPEPFHTHAARVAAHAAGEYALNLTLRAATKTVFVVLTRPDITVCDELGLWYFAQRNATQRNATQRVGGPLR